MTAEKDDAIVLRVVPFSETSAVLTLYTKRHGKVSALAKGARRPKSSFESALDVLAICRVVFLAKQGQTLDLLTEAKLERRFRCASRDLTRLYAGYYVVELLRELTIEGNPQPQLYGVAYHAVCSLDDGGDPLQEIVVFAARTLRLLGHLPASRNCVECGRDVDSSGRIAFGHREGGVLCWHCKPGKRNVVTISQAALEILRELADVNCQGLACVQQPGARRAVGELRGVLDHYVQHLIGRRLRTTEYLVDLYKSSTG